MCLGRRRPLLHNKIPALLEITENGRVRIHWSRARVQSVRRSSHSPRTDRVHRPQMNGWHALRSCRSSSCPSRRSAVMNDYDPTSPHETLPTRPVSSATSGPPVAGSSGGAGAAPPPPPASSPDSLASVTMAKQARRPGVRRLVSNRKSGGIVAAALMCAVIGFSAGCATSPSATTTSPRQQPRPRRQLQGSPCPAAGDPTLGLDRPQGEHPARSTACPRRASQ